MATQKENSRIKAHTKVCMIQIACDGANMKAHREMCFRCEEAQKRRKSGTKPLKGSNIK